MLFSHLFHTLHSFAALCYILFRSAFVCSAFNIIWDWKDPAPAWYCCCGPSSWLWCSCCAVLPPGCGCGWTPAARRPIGSACAPACCGCCCPSVKSGPAEKRWCAAGVSSSSGSRCLHPDRSCFYATPCACCWAWLGESAGWTRAVTNELHILQWWTCVGGKKHAVIISLLFLVTNKFPLKLWVKCYLTLVLHLFWGSSNNIYLGGRETDRGVDWNIFGWSVASEKLHLSLELRLKFLK